MALSGIVLGSDKTQYSEEETTAPANKGVRVDTPSTKVDPVTQAALRQFHVGTALQYVYYIYNAKREEKTGSPRLTTQIRLFREGKQIFEGKANIVEINGQTDLKRLSVGGHIQLGDFVPGEYILQVEVTDTLTKEKTKTVREWIDFEIVK